MIELKSWTIIVSSILVSIMDPWLIMHIPHWAKIKDHYSILDFSLNQGFCFVSLGHLYGLHKQAHAMYSFVQKYMQYIDIHKLFRVLFLCLSIYVSLSLLSTSTIVEFNWLKKNAIWQRSLMRASFRKHVRSFNKIKWRIWVLYNKTKGKKQNHPWGLS